MNKALLILFMGGTQPQLKVLNVRQINCQELPDLYSERLLAPKEAFICEITG